MVRFPTWYKFQFDCIERHIGRKLCPVEKCALWLLLEVGYGTNRKSYGKKNNKK